MFSEATVFCFFLFIFKSEALESLLEALCTWIGLANWWASPISQELRCFTWGSPQMSMWLGLLSGAMQSLHPCIQFSTSPLLSSTGASVPKFRATLVKYLHSMKDILLLLKQTFKSLCCHPHATSPSPTVSSSSNSVSF